MKNQRRVKVCVAMYLEYRSISRSLPKFRAWLTVCSPLCDIFNVLPRGSRAAKSLRAFQPSLATLRALWVILQGHMAGYTDAEVVAKETRLQREHRFKQVDIPADQVVIFGDTIGNRGCGTVYIADYNGKNAAAKVFDLDVVSTEDCVPGQQQGEDNKTTTKEAQSLGFLREVETMKRLSSPNTVQVYGAVTALRGRFVLVMELLSGGDLRSLLKRSTEPLAETLVRQIIGDICNGVSFLHSKSIIHGDLKSANVLFDGVGRAKVSTTTFCV